MLKFSVCIDALLTEYDYADRVKRTKELGFSATEFWFWKNKDTDLIAKASREYGVPIAGMCTDTKREKPETYHGPLYMEDSEELCRIAKDSAELAKKMGVGTLIMQTGDERLDIPRDVQHANLVLNLRRAAKIYEDAGVTLVVEPLNTLYNHRGYYLSSSYEGFSIIREVDSPNVKLLYDVYHQQVTEGNLINNITDNIDLIGHMHIADVPGRGAPGTGEINWKNVFAAIEKSGYDKYVGLEYFTASPTEKSLEKFIEDYSEFTR